MSQKTGLERGKEVESIKFWFANHLKYTLGKDQFTATDHDRYIAMAMTIRDLMVERLVETQQTYHESNIKRVYYLSLEYLMGRSLSNNIINLGIKDKCQKTLQDLAIEWESIASEEVDAGLGNGGLGRLAACFLDSMATLSLPATGYGLRYDYGIFRQEIRDGYQVEEPDEWLRWGNPWEIARPESTFEVGFGGAVEESYQGGKRAIKWNPAYAVLGIPYDTPIIGYGSENANILRLWSAKASSEFDFDDFSEGDYVEAVKHKTLAENLTKVLYPNDSNYQGKDLRFRQQYFFIACSLQDIVRRYKVHNQGFDNFPDKVAIQLNDTHPAVAVAELMRMLVDLENLGWDKAWDITVNTFGYTNHTLLPEALEQWPVEFFQRILPRHLQIIYEINSRFLQRVSMRYPGDNQRLTRMSIVAEQPQKSIRMAYLAVVGSHSINGVAELHTALLKQNVLRDFYELMPERFNNKTNGITPRRWLLHANPELADWITKKIGPSWAGDLMLLRRLEAYSKDKNSCAEFRQIKMNNKVRLSAFISEQIGVAVNPQAIFDVQIKRLHEYKRQLLNLLHIVALYTRLKDDPDLDMVPRVFIFSAKSAPGYFMAKLIIKLINSVAKVVNSDASIQNKLKVVFLPNYGVSLAEIIVPATDVSEQISTAGMEASGTGNMKLALNGALTVGTLDGANIEIREEVGEENIFIFGLTADEIQQHKRNRSYNPWEFYHGDLELRRSLDLISSNFFSLYEPGIFEPILENLLHHGDPYFILADFRAYVECHSKVERLYRDPAGWNEKAILNVARMGKFSSDRVIQQYAKEIWHATPLPIDLHQKRGHTVVMARKSKDSQS